MKLKTGALYLIGVAFFISVFTGAAFSEDSAVSWSNKGVEQLNTGNSAGADQSFSKAIDLDPEKAIVWYYRGIARHRLGKDKAALADLSRTVELAPDHAPAYSLRGFVYSKSGQNENGLADYSRAIQLKPDSDMYLFNRGVLYQNMGRYQEAVSDYSGVIRLKPDHGKAYFYRSESFDALGKLDEAVQDAEKAVRLDPQKKEYRNFLNTLQEKVETEGSTEKKEGKDSQKDKQDSKTGGAFEENGSAFEYFLSTIRNRLDKQESGKPDENEKKIDYDLTKYFKPTDLLSSIARNLEAVRTGKMEPFLFFKELANSKGTMFHVMQVKAHIENVGGDKMLARFLGERFPEGGSPVEMELLSSRRRHVERGIQFACRNAGLDADMNSAYLSRIGGWAAEAPQAMRFAGDIDFSFVSSDDGVLKALDAHFDEYIRSTTGLGPTEFDAVCTRHGKARSEVYVGPHGAEFARKAMEAGELFRLNPDGPSETGVKGETALTHLANEAYMGKANDKIELGKHATGPGLSMEMIRHFEHDIMKGRENYTPMDLFFKSAKYLNRSDDSMAAELSKKNLLDKKLSEFVAELVIKKNEAKFGEAVELIKIHYGGVLPLNANIEPTTAGRARAAIKGNDKLINGLFKEVRQAMWHNASSVFDYKYKDLAERYESLKKQLEKTDQQKTLITDAEKLRSDLFDLKEMVDIEFKVLTNDHVAIPKNVVALKKKLDRLASGFNSDFAKLKLKKISPADMKHLEYVRQMVETGKLTAIRIAAAHMMNLATTGIDKTNNTLDFADDWLLGRLRGEQSFDQFLEDYRETRTGMEDAKDDAGKRTSLVEGFRDRAKRKYFVDLQNRFNQKLVDSCIGRGIRAPNVAFAEHLKNDAVDRGGMKALAAFNLAMEINAYYDAFNKQGWSGLTTEFMRRRVPFVSSLDNAIQGNYMLAAWDIATDLVPPLALPQAAWAMGQMAMQSGISIYYSTELTLYIDALYDQATFELKSTTHFGDGKIGHWRLIRFKYKGRKVGVADYLAKSRNIAREYQQVIKKKLDDREYPDFNFGITGDMDAEMVLVNNLKVKDPVIMMLDGLIKGEYAGERVKSYFRDQKAARWAVVKHKFVQDTIKALEARKQAEMAINMGQVEDIRKAFHRILGKLKITDKVIETLSSEQSYEWVQDVKDMVNWIVDQKRTLEVQGGVEYEYVKAVKILIDYVDRYEKILKLRDAVEKEFAMGRIEDAGLRTLTGPKNLTGRPDRDEKRAMNLIKQVAVSRIKLQEQLLKIKQEAIPESELEGAFDKRIEDALQFHSVWWDQWQYIFTKSRDIPEDQDKALERAEYHGEEKKKLIAEFEEFYSKTTRIVISLRVRKEDGAEQPVIGAIIKAGVPDQSMRSFTEDVDGRYILEQAAMGDYAVSIEAKYLSDGKEKTEQMQVKLTVPAPAEEDELKPVEKIVYIDEGVSELPDALPAFEIVATRSTYDGAPVEGPIENGDIIALKAKVPHPDTEEPLISNLIWQLYDGAGNPVSEYQHSVQAYESGGVKDYRIRFRLKDLENGSYTVGLTHQLAADPEIDFQATKSFKLYQALRIKRIWVTDTLGGETHKPVLKNDKLPHLYAAFDMAEGIDSIQTRLTARNKRTGKEIYTLSREYKRDPKKTYQRTGIRLAGGAVKIGDEAEFEAEITAPGGTAQTAKETFSVEPYRISLKAPARIDSQETGRFAISVPEEFEPPFTVDVDARGMVIGRSGKNALSGTLTGIAEKTDATVKLYAAVTDSAGRAGEASVSVTIIAPEPEPEKKPSVGYTPKPKPSYVPPKQTFKPKPKKPYAPPKSKPKKPAYTSQNAKKKSGDKYMATLQRGLDRYIAWNLSILQQMLPSCLGSIKTNAIRKYKADTPTNIVAFKNKFSNHQGYFGAYKLKQFAGPETKILRDIKVRELEKTLNETERVFGTVQWDNCTEQWAENTARLGKKYDVPFYRDFFNKKGKFLQAMMKNTPKCKHSYMISVYYKKFIFGKYEWRWSREMLKRCPSEKHKGYTETTRLGNQVYYTTDQSKRNIEKIMSTASYYKITNKNKIIYQRGTPPKK